MALDEKHPEIMSVVPMEEATSEIDLSKETDQLFTEPSEPEEYYNFGHHIKTNYREVFLEPRHYEKSVVGSVMAPWIKGVTSVAFENVQASLYYGLTFLIGIILSVVWGLVFAINGFVVVWVLQPYIKIYFVWLRVYSVLYKALVRIALDPLYESCALVFSRIAGKFVFNLNGLPETSMVTRV